jgi:Right handed beta helix region
MAQPNVFAASRARRHPTNSTPSDPSLFSDVGSPLAGDSPSDVSSATQTKRSLKMNLKPRLMTGIALALALLVTGGTAFAKHHAAVFKVLPTGTNDTANLQAALDAAVQAGPGSTVQLVKGTYYIDKGLAVANFDGTFAGAGKDKTYIQNLGKFSSPYENFLSFSLEGQNVRPCLVKLSDLTFRAIGANEPDLNFWMTDTEGNPIPMNGYGILGLTGDLAGNLNASVVRVGFEGQTGDQYVPWGCNIHDTAGFSSADWGPLGGNCLFQDCTLKNALGGIFTLSLQDGHFKVEGCTFDDVMSPIGAINLSGNTAAEILCNRIQMGPNWAPAVWMESEMPGSNVTVRISHNEISVASYMDGIRIEDFGSQLQAGAPTIKHTVISDNDIRLNGIWNGAIGGAFASNVTVANNTISGHGRLGIYTGNTESMWWGLAMAGPQYDFLADNFTPPASNWVIVGNNLKHADTYYAPILLGPNTSHFLVKADPNDVTNLGTGNTIIGVHPKH